MLERADFNALDPWIDLIFDRIDQHPLFAHPADELAAVSSTMIATLYRQPSHPRLSFLAERTRALIAAEVGVNQKVAAATFLLNYYVWTGETTGADELVALILPSLSHAELAPLRRASWELRLAIHNLSLGEFEKTLANKTLAAEIAREHSFAAIEMTARIFEARLFLCEADIARAEAALAQVYPRLSPTRRMGFSIALKFKGWVALAKGDVDAAVQLGEHAREVGETAGAPTLQSHTLIYLAHAYSERHDYDKAHAALRSAEICTALERYPVFQFDAELVRADLLLREGNREGCEAALRTALSLGARRGYLSSLFWVPRMMERLCAVALEGGIETAYVKHLIGRRRLEPPTPDVVHWPWPLRVFTLGRFAVEQNGEPAHFGRKVPKKPLDLLKALIAHGVGEVSSEQLCAALWPDAEADAAANSLGITLQRLRKLLGDERVVSHHGGKLALDSRRCWVDAWALQEVLDRADATLHIGSTVAELEQIAARIRELSRGGFLTTESEQPWSLPLRDRLKATVTRVVLSLGQRLEDAGKAEAAIELYHRALEQDNLAEDLYRRLIVCHARLGHRAEAMAAYLRCRELLSIVLGIQPSVETERIAHELQAA